MIIFSINVYNKQLLQEGFSVELIKSSSAYGVSVATAVLEWAKLDGSFKKHPDYVIPTGEGSGFRHRICTCWTVCSSEPYMR
jgi:hypothetical protein